MSGTLSPQKGETNIIGQTVNRPSTPPMEKEKMVQDALKAVKLINATNLPQEDVWKLGDVDTSRIDRLLGLLKTKIETLNGFVDDPERAVKKIFASADVEKNGFLDQDEFLRLLTEKLNFVGVEKEIVVLFRRFDVDKTGSIDASEFINVILNKPPNKASTVIGKIREILARRAGGTSTLKSLALQFKIMDSESNGTVSRDELEIGMIKFLNAFGVKLTPKELDVLFSQFDYNGDGIISYDEFIRGIRGGMNEFRIDFVKKAFSLLDIDKSGFLTLEEIAIRYDVSKHPQVLAGKMTKTEALKIFLSQWKAQNIKKEGDTVSLDDFIEYYEWVSSSIDRDDYFELMMRNAWHLSGGRGWSENTSNLRVLVTFNDGTQKVIGVENDLGLKRDDPEGIKKRLIEQGVSNIKAISLKD